MLHFLKYRKKENNQLLWKSNLDKGVIIKQIFFSANGKKIADTIQSEFSTKTQLLPRFYDGKENYNKFIKNNFIKYLNQFDLKEGHYKLHYKINKNGESIFVKLLIGNTIITNINLINFLTAKLRMLPKWQPAVQLDRTVSVFNLITFSIKKD